jgi:hypothetical protein
MKIARNMNVVQHCTSPREITQSKFCLKQEFQWGTKTLMLWFASHVHLARSLRIVKYCSNTTRNWTLIRDTKYHTISCYFLIYASSVTLMLWFTAWQMSGVFPVGLATSSTNSIMTRVSLTIYTWKPRKSLILTSSTPNTEAAHSLETLAPTHQTTAWRRKAGNNMNLRRRVNLKSYQKKIEVRVIHKLHHIND